MAYCVQADLERAAGGVALFLKLADHNGDGTADTDVVADAISDAERYVDSYLARRYSVPLASPSDVIRRVTAEEAVYILRKDSVALGNVEGVFSDLQLVHLQNVLWLEGVAAGKINPGVDPAPTKSSAVGASIGTRANSTDTDMTDTLVTRSSLKGFW